MKTNWNFLGGRGEGAKTKNLLWVEYGYFLELHNIEKQTAPQMTVESFHLDFIHKLER